MDPLFLTPISFVFIAIAIALLYTCQKYFGSHKSRRTKASSATPQTPIIVITRPEQTTPTPSERITAKQSADFSSSNENSTGTQGSKGCICAKKEGKDHEKYEEEYKNNVPLHCGECKWYCGESLVS